jgi:hypothetical protein
VFPEIGELGLLYLCIFVGERTGKLLEDVVWRERRHDLIKGHGLERFKPNHCERVGICRGPEAEDVLSAKEYSDFGLLGSVESILSMFQWGYWGSQNGMKTSVVQNRRRCCS